jgi:hypothetical protein
MGMTRAPAASMTILAALHCTRVRGKSNQRQLPGKHQEQARQRGDYPHASQTSVRAQQHSSDFSAHARE